MGGTRPGRLPVSPRVEVEGRDGRKQRIGGGIVLGIGGLPQRRAAGGRLLRVSNLREG